MSTPTDLTCPQCGWDADTEANRWEAWCYACCWWTTAEADPATYLRIRNALTAARNT